jgi:hypothetical protein
MQAPPPPERAPLGMRRKSSAQNLLGFKRDVPDAGGPPPSAYAPPPQTPREWDGESVASGTTYASTGTLVPAPSVGAPAGGLPQGASLEALRAMVDKRIITLTYMRNVHDGCVSRQVCVPPTETTCG